MFIDISVQLKVHAVIFVSFVNVCFMKRCLLRTQIKKQTAELFTLSSLMSVTVFTRHIIVLKAGHDGSTIRGTGGS